MVPIGLILLAALAVLTFFGVTERFFRKVGIPDWLAFLLVLSFVIGAVVPDIPIGTRLSLNVGGFIIPAVFIVILFSVTPAKGGAGAWRGIISALAVAGVTVAVRMLIRPEAAGGLLIVTAAVTGLLGGIVAYLAGGTRLGTLSGAVGGIMLGDIANNLILRFLDGANVTLGARGVFDSIILAAVTGIVILEIVEAIKRTMGEKNITSTALNTEAAEDARFADDGKAGAAKDEEFKNYFEDVD